MKIADKITELNEPVILAMCISISLISFIIVFVTIAIIVAICCYRDIEVERIKANAPQVEVTR